MSVPSRSQAANALSRRLVGRVAALLLMLSGVITMVSPLLPAPPTFNQTGVIGVGIVGLALGIIVWFLPWQHWSRRASLALVPLAYGLIALHNYFGGVDPYRYSVFFMVVVAWIGVAHGRGTNAMFAPLLLLAYLLPLLAINAPMWAISSSMYVIPISLLLGEVLGWITARWQETQHALQHSEARFRSLVQNSSDIVLITDAEGRITYQSPSTSHVLGYAHDHLLGKRLTELSAPDDQDNVQALFHTLISPTEAAPRPTTYRALHANGSWRWIETIGTNLLTDPHVQGIVLNSRDITERRQLEQQLRHQALHDALTGLPNRVLFHAQIEAALARSRRRQTRLAVLFLDLDNFKQVNDTQGHRAGDLLLQLVAERLRGSVRANDLPARMGGDEFAVLLEDIATIDDAIFVAERIIAELLRPFTLGGQTARIGTSIGIATGNGSHASAADLLRHADDAMYRAKQHGKGQYAIHELLQPTPPQM